MDTALIQTHQSTSLLLGILIKLLNLALMCVCPYMFLDKVNEICVARIAK